MTTPQEPRTGTTTVKAQDVTLTTNFDEQVLTLVYKGFLVPKHKKKLENITIPFEEIDHFEWEGKSYVRVILHRWRNDRSEMIATDASEDPLVFHAGGKKQREQLKELFAAVEGQVPRFQGRPFVRPPRHKGKLTLPALAFGEVSLDGNEIVYKRQRFPIAGAKAELDTGAGGGTNLSVGRALVGGALFGGAGAVLGGVTGNKGQVVLGLLLADGRTIMTTGAAKELDTAVSIVNEISEWSPKLLASLEEGQ